jgi:hypothetical protein
MLRNDIDSPRNRGILTGRKRPYFLINIRSSESLIILLNLFSDSQVKLTGGI